MVSLVWARPTIGSALWALPTAQAVGVIQRSQDVVDAVALWATFARSTRTRAAILLALALVTGTLIAGATTLRRVVGTLLRLPALTGLTLIGLTLTGLAGTGLAWLGAGRAIGAADAAELALGAALRLLGALLARLPRLGFPRLGFALLGFARLRLALLAHWRLAQLGVRFLRR